MKRLEKDSIMSFLTRSQVLYLSLLVSLCSTRGSQSILLFRPNDTAVLIHSVMLPYLRCNCMQLQQLTELKATHKTRATNNSNRILKCASHSHSLSKTSFTSFTYIWRRNYLQRRPCFNDGQLATTFVKAGLEAGALSRVLAGFPPWHLEDSVRAPWGHLLGSWVPMVSWHSVNLHSNLSPPANLPGTHSASVLPWFNIQNKGICTLPLLSVPRQLHWLLYRVATAVDIIDQLSTTFKICRCTMYIENFLDYPSQLC